ncbi:MAG: LysR family transcriptional regulator [Pseudobdellovibrionaceae bacterium]
MDNILSLPYLELLRSFVVFVQSNNIVDAATELKISQPLLSLHLSQIEKSLGVQLFEKKGRKKTLTPAGLQFYDMALQVLLDLAKSIHHFININEHKKYLRIGGRKEILGDVIDHLHFDGSIDFVERSGIQILPAFQEGQIDIAISRTEIISTEIIRRKLFADELELAWNPSIAIDGSNHLLDILNQLQSYRFLSYGKSSPADAVFSHFKLTSNFLCHSTVQDWSKISSMLVAQKCWSIIPSRYSQNKKFKKMDIGHRIYPQTVFYIYYSKRMSRLDWFKGAVDSICRIFEKSY